jgi:hypothetical protein
MTAQRPARRRMKARTAKRLGCGCVPHRGEWIIRLDDGTWVCEDHGLALALDAIRAKQDGAP